MRLDRQRLGHVAAAGCLLVAGVVIAGCSKEQLAEIQAKGDEVRFKRRVAIEAEMKVVLAHVRPEHVAQCRQLSERDVFGKPINLRGPLAPHLQSTCNAIVEDWSGLLGERSRKYVAFLAPIGTNTSIFAPKGVVQVGCTMVLENGQITVRKGAADRAPSNNPCHGVY